MRPLDRTNSSIWESRFSQTHEVTVSPDTSAVVWGLGPCVLFTGLWYFSRRRSLVSTPRIDRSRRGEANAAPGPDQLFDLGKSIFSIQFLRSK